MITDLSDGLILSADGKTVTGFKKGRRKTGMTMIRIPSGVETIEDNALLRLEIDKLILPKELKYLGKYTICHPYGYGPYMINPKAIGSIEVEEGNQHFMSDGTGFYTIGNGKKTLLRLFSNNGLTTYTAPDDLTSFEFESLASCPSLKQVVLPDGVESFDEYALPHDTKVVEVFLPKSVKHLRAKSLSGAFSTWNTVSYRIDEENEHLFRDEDSIYEILDDGTYKLVTCQYTGKGKVLFLDGTSVIGANAFEGHKCFARVEFPKSLRIIEKRAFAQTALQSLVVPNGVLRIESGAFSRCDDLKSVQLDPGLEYIAEDAFQSCNNLQTIKSDGENVFSFQYGVIKRIAKRVEENTAASNVVSGYTEKKTGHNTPTVSAGDRFAKFAEIIVQEIAWISVSSRENVSDRAKYDEQKRTVFITTAFVQYSQNADVVKERVACAETVKENDPVDLKKKGDIWEVITKKGDSLGQLDRFIANQAFLFWDVISVNNCVVASITPKSKRRSNSKYATGSVRFEITERQT